MALLEKYLVIKKSVLPGAGKGLFTTVPIKKGTLIIEYKGEILTWKEVEAMADHRVGYVFFVYNTHVIDAWNYKSAKARYANDAKGLNRIPGVVNNSEYHVYQRRCFIKAKMDIPAGAEILVSYGSEYWQVIRHNLKEDLKTSVKGKGLPRLPHQDVNRRRKRR